MVVSQRTARWLAAAVLTGLIITPGEQGRGLAQTVFQGGTQDHACSQNVREKLVELGVDPDGVKGVTIQRREVRRRVGNRVRKQLVGYKAWVVPSDGKGNLVMDLFLNCRVQRVYATGGFTLPGDAGEAQ